MNSELEQVAPPENVQRTLKKVELGAGALVVFLLVLSGLAWTIGITTERQDTGSSGSAEQDKRTFKPLVADFRGEVEYRPAGSRTWRQLQWSDAIAEGDRLRTGGDSVCDLLLTWGTGVRLTPNSEVTWRELVAQGALRHVKVFLTQGRILASLDALPKGSRFVIVTRHSEVKVRGTVLSVSADEEKSEVTVLKGVVEVVDSSDATRRVQVTTGTGVEFGSGGDGQLRPLSASERALLIGETSSVDKRVQRLSPGLPKVEKAPTAAPKADDTGPAASESVGPKPVSSTSIDATGQTRTQDVEAVTDLLRAGIILLDQGNVEAALVYCTMSFRAIIWGPMARRSGVAQEIARELGDPSLLRERDQLREVLALSLKAGEIEVQLDGDVAYGSVIVTAIARPKSGDQQIKRVVRNYACSARLLRQKDGGWLLDLVTATEIQLGGG